MGSIRQTVTLGSSPVPWSHAATPSLSPSAVGTSWDDGSIYASRMVENLDGTLYRDSSGYAYITYLASTKSLQDATGTDNDRPGLYKTIDFVTFTKVTTSAPILTWGTGSWITDGSVWDGRVVQLSSLIYLGNAGFVAFYDGDAGENPLETYAMGVATATNIAGPWTKYGSNPTFSRQSPSSQDEVIYGGDIVYDLDDANANKRWKMFYIGKSNSSGNIRMRLATAASYLGPWTRQGSVYTDSDNSTGYSAGLTQVWKTGATSMQAIWEQYSGGGQTAGLAQMKLITSSDSGASWSDVGLVMKRTNQGWETGSSFYWTFHLWDSVEHCWRLIYTHGTNPPGNETGLRIASVSWRGPRTVTIT